MKVKSEQLTTERLVLKCLEDRDMEPMFRIVSDARVKRTYMLPDFADQAQQEAFFKRLQTLCVSEEHFVYGIYLGAELIGFLNDCEMDEANAELGYFIAPEHWDHGYASEALRAAIDELFRMGYQRVTAGYFEGNEASRRVMEKCGMKLMPRQDVISYRGVEHRCFYCEIERN